MHGVSYHCRGLLASGIHLYGVVEGDGQCYVGRALNTPYLPLSFLKRPFLIHDKRKLWQNVQVHGPGGLERLMMVKHIYSICSTSRLMKACY